MFETIPTENEILFYRLIKKGNKKGNVYFTILNKKIERDFVLVITNEYGRVIRELQYPKKVTPKKNVHKNKPGYGQMNKK